MHFIRYDSNSQSNLSEKKQKNKKKTLYISAHRQKTYLRTCAPSENSDQTAYSESSLGAYRIEKDATDSSSGQRRLWPDCADAQADLSLRRECILEGTFSHLTNHTQPRRKSNNIRKWYLILMLYICIEIKIELNFVTKKKKKKKKHVFCFVFVCVVCYQRSICIRIYFINISRMADKWLTQVQTLN